ncbi:MAG TPA: esterase-like activity of phytase family protein [Mycobacteriales bacterium]|nr:esterase-like activity of phytase family protein [Mycobacteriales bacterium]
MIRRTLAVALAGGVAAAVTAVGPASAHQPDGYRVHSGHSLNAQLELNGTLISHTAPAHGTVKLDPSGRFHYTPAAGFTGTDSFRYTTSDAVRLYSTDLPPLATIGGVKITGGAYGSSFTPVPGHRNLFYGLTDRGPNVDAPDGAKVEPLPEFQPAIGEFRLTGHKAVLLKRIGLQAADGTPYNGQVDPQATTGETIEDRNGNPLPTSPNGYDPEGLVAMPDGTFWVSDEYGPFITHFDRTGRQIERLSPFGGGLPAELAMRVPNKGMEGLTVTPDGRTLVGIMQSALQTPDLTDKPGNVAPLRIVTYDLKSRATHEYLYLLDDPKDNDTAVSEITAVSNTDFIVDERDGDFEPGAYKKLFSIDISSATDVGPHARGTYDAAKGGLLMGPKHESIEAFAGDHKTATVQSDLRAAGIRPVTKSLRVDIGRLVTGLDPTGAFFGHDKVEGVASIDHGRTLVVSNDNDFGIDGVSNDSPPYTLHAKILPNGQQDDGEYLAIDTTRLHQPARTGTVTITVQ